MFHISENATLSGQLNKILWIAFSESTEIVSERGGTFFGNLLKTNKLTWLDHFEIIMIYTNFNRGSITVKPKTIPGGKEVVLRKLPKDFQVLKSIKYKLSTNSFNIFI